MEELGIKGRLRDPGYFRLKPYGEGELCNRADQADKRVLKWLREGKTNINYLTGFSGTGKSSLLQASVLPALRNSTPPYRIAEARTYGASCCRCP